MIKEHSYNGCISGDQCPNEKKQYRKDDSCIRFAVRGFVLDGWEHFCCFSDVTDGGCEKLAAGEQFVTH